MHVGLHLGTCVAVVEVFVAAAVVAFETGAAVFVIEVVAFETDDIVGVVVAVVVEVYVVAAFETGVV